MKFSVGDIGVECVEGIEKIIDLYVMQKPNTHPVAKIKYLSKADVDMGKLQKKIAEKLLRIFLKSNQSEKTVFYGYIDEVEIEELETGERYVVLKLLSASIHADLQLKNRSFQKKTATYKEIVEDVLQENGNVVVKWNAETNMEIGTPVMQFYETNWEFAKRMASMSNSCVIVDMEKEKPTVHVGVPKYDRGMELKKNIYKVGFSSKHGADGGKNRTSNYIYYKVYTTKSLKLGEKVLFKNGNWFVYQKELELYQECVRYCYILVRKNFFYTKTYYNKNFIGRTIIGTVLETAKETVKLDLHLEDDSHDYANAYPYHWKPETGNFAYIMPKKGSEVSLYFSEQMESSAIAINCIRKNGVSSPKMENTQNKRFTTEADKVMDLDMDQLYFSTSTKDPFAALKLMDDKAIRFKTKGYIYIDAVEKILFNSNNVFTSSAYKQYYFNEKYSPYLNALSISLKKMAPKVLTSSAAISLEEFANILNKCTEILNAMNRIPDGYFDIQFGMFSLYGIQTDVKWTGCCCYPMIDDAPTVTKEKDFPWGKFFIGVAGAIVGTVAVVAIGALCVGAAPLVLISAGVAGMVAGTVASYNMAKTEQNSTKEYEWSKYLFDGAFQSIVAASSVVFLPEGAAWYAELGMSELATAISVLGENWLLGNDLTNGLGENLFYSGISFGACRVIGGVGGQIRKLKLFQNSKIVNGIKNNKLYSKFANKVAMLTDEEFEKILNSMDDAEADTVLGKLKNRWKTKLRNSKYDKVAQKEYQEIVEKVEKSKSSKRRAKQNLNRARNKKNKNGIEYAKDNNRKAKQNYKDLLEEQKGYVNNIFNKEANRKIYEKGVGSLSDSGTRIFSTKGVPLLQDGFQFFFGEEESSLMVQNEDNCVYLQENSKAAWNLCTGLPGYVEDVEEYKKGVLIDGMEE